MKALIVDGSGTRLDASAPNPTPLEGEAVVRTIKAAVSSIDTELSRGMSGFHGVPGQQFVGTVESIHGGHDKLVGRRVVGSIICACGKCDLCQGGLSAHCRERTILGMQGRNGCLAERFTLPSKNLAIVPEAIDNDHAVFAVELASAIHAAQQLTIVNKPYITVLGDGSLGLLMVQVMSKLNASVRLVGQQPDQLAICEKWGIKHRHVNDVGRRADQDIVVDCTGTDDGLAVAMRLVRPRGKIVMKSLHGPTANATPSIDLSPIVLNEIELIGSFAGPIGEALAVLQRREVDVVSLISKRMALADGPAILKAARQPGVVKVLVDC
jgi:alcohol dehydrogenase